MEKTVVTFRVGKKLLNKIESESKKTHRKRSNLINYILKKYFKTKDDE